MKQFIEDYFNQHEFLPNLNNVDDYNVINKGTEIEVIFKGKYDTEHHTVSILDLMEFIYTHNKK